MSRGYNNIFWGLFFATFNIKIGAIKIFPAFVGWLLIVHGIKLLYDEYSSENFRKAYKYAIITTLVSFLGGFLTLLGMENDIFLYTSIVFAVFQLIFVYYLLEGSIEYLISADELSIASDYETKLKSYIVIFLINVMIQCVAITVFSSALLIIVAIVGIGLILWLMMMVNYLKKLLYDK